MLEDDVANGERLVNNQDLWFGANGNGKGKPYVHSARIGLHRLLDKITDLCEPFDFREPRFRLAFGKPEQGSIQIDVLYARELRVESRPKLQQRCNATLVIDAAMCGLECARHDLK